MRGTLMLIGTGLLLGGYLLGASVAPAPVSGASTDVAAEFKLADFANGEVDCTEALQQWIDSGKGPIVLPKGTFRISRPLLIELNRVGFSSVSGQGVARLLMTGPGPALRFVGTHGGTAAPHTVQPQVWDRERTPLVDALEIVGDHPEAVGVEANGTMQLSISRLVVRKCLHAVHLTGRNRNVLLSECHFYENAGIGVFLDRLNLHQINIVNCHISYNRQGGVVSRMSEIRNLQIGSCDIEGNMGGLDDPPSANIELDSTESSIGEVAIVGCTIQHGHNARDSANIRINTLSKEVPFTEERRHGNITIADNIFSDVQVNLEIRHTRGVTVTGNTFWQGYEHNLILDHCSSVVLANNVFERNPRYHYGDGAEARLGVLITQCSDCTLTGNLFSGSVLHDASVMIRDCQRMNVSGCSIVDYDVLGLELSNVHNSLVTGCLISKSGGTPESAIRATGNNLQLHANLTEEK
ncbi:MAG: right-handed parallel beta-helix repeat-containing protein [Planctomycetaceae bacterium]